MTTNAAKPSHTMIPPAARGWALWRSEEDPAQDSIDSAVAVLVSVEMGAAQVSMRADEARALLVLAQEASSLASNYLDSVTGK